jgi:predicted alpha-1,2-mannosidase
MIGYHSVAVIADAYVKGIRGFDGKKALDACITTSIRSFYEGIGDYMKCGYVPDEKNGNSASITLEYAYDDYAIACLAKALNDTTIAGRYLKRSLNYRNIFDPSMAFIRPKKMDGSWKAPFDPLSTHGQGFIEGNSWNYSFYMPQDIPHYIGMMGGERVFIRRLDSLFNMHLDDKYFKETEDVTRVGIIGNYVHGNEPSHHIPYLYNWTSKPWKTQEKIPMILKSMYRNAPDGLCGNDDCGQMSAWYIFSALGFYPVCPGTTQYAIGSPFVDEAVITLPNNKTLTIEAPGLSDKNIYIQSASLNGKSIKTPFLDHKDILSGGVLIFIMGPKPKKW